MTSSARSIVRENITGFLRFIIRRLSSDDDVGGPIVPEFRAAQSQQRFRLVRGDTFPLSAPECHETLPSRGSGCRCVAEWPSASDPCRKSLASQVHEIASSYSFRSARHRPHQWGRDYDLRKQCERAGRYLLLLTTATACAQDLVPRAYLITPTGSNAVTVGYSWNKGDVVFDPSVPIEDAKGTFQTPVLSYYHSTHCSAAHPTSSFRRLTAREHSKELSTESAQ